MNPLAPYLTQVKFSQLSPASKSCLGNAAAKYKQTKMISDFNDRKSYVVHVRIFFYRISKSRLH